MLSLLTLLIFCRKIFPDASTESGKHSKKVSGIELLLSKKINDFNRQWLVACRKKLKNGGTIFVTGTYHNIFSVASCMQELGYKILNIICWQKQTPNQLCRATILILQQNILFGQEKMKYISISLIVI